MRSIAIVNTWGEPFIDWRVGGILHALNHLENDLKILGHTVHKYFFTNKKKRNKNWDPTYKPVHGKDHVGILNNYDLVIFSTAGNVDDKNIPPNSENAKPLWYMHLSKLEVPFFVQNHGEADFKNLTWSKWFLSHKNCKLLMPVANGLFEGVDGYNPSDKDELTYPCYSLRNTPNPKDYYKNKRNLITTACRMTSRKRVKELVEIEEQVHNAGFEIELHGAHSSYFYIKALKEITKGHSKIFAEFSAADRPNIYGPAKFLWQPFCFKKKHKITKKRLELPPVEAAFYGCVPILQNSTVPEFLNSSNAFLIDVFNLNNFVKSLQYYEKHYIEVNQNFISVVKENQFTNLFKLNEFIEKI